MIKSKLTCMLGLLILPMAFPAHAVVSESSRPQTGMYQNNYQSPYSNSNPYPGQSYSNNPYSSQQSSYSQHTNEPMQYGSQSYQGYQNSDQMLRPDNPQHGQSMYQR